MILLLSHPLIISIASLSQVLIIEAETGVEFLPRLQTLLLIVLNQRLYVIERLTFRPHRLL